jgi:signal transduction histidine kinase/CheY-like chemotaxis protein/HPt (histidine-containing phosphotransfer) domain-containing protein
MLFYQLIYVKKLSIQIKIGFLMVLAVTLLSAAGYLSYRNISSIVSSINIDEKPERRLISIREISMDLEVAQNCIRIYSVTKDPADIKPYYKIISNIDEKVSRLRSECMNDSLLLSQTDAISKLIEENIVIWNKLLNLNTDQKVVEYLKQLSDSLIADSQDARKADKNILNGVFGSNNKSRIDEMELLVDLQEIEHQDRIAKENLKRRESQLARTGSEIKKQFYNLITKIEDETSGFIKAKALEADKLARKTYIWLAMFSVSGTLLAIIVMFIIVRYVRKTHAYQIALQNSKNETEKLARTKELFVANMSHEIRTPVTAISGFTEQLLHEKFDENTTRTIKIIKSSSDHLARIINDILDFSKLQNDKLVLEKVHFNVGQILNDLYLLFEKQALRNNNKLSYSLDPLTPEVLLGDPYRLKQIFINLLSNAIKFTMNGKIHFSVKGKTMPSGQIELAIEVVDTGIGIDESKIKLIFEDFTQEEMSTTRKYGGTGLGLSIVKKLVELQKGRIDCKSRKNQGTSITCHIPFLPGDRNEIKGDILTAVYIPDDIRKLKILIVDDEEYNRLLFKTILDRWNVKYSEAAGGTEALELLRTNRFDMVFMDIRMPGLDGLSLTKVIRNEMNITQLAMPVICISAVSVNEDLQIYRDAGMNAFMPKPFTEELLLTTILSVISDFSQLSEPERLNDEKSGLSIAGKINLQSLYHLSGGDEQFVKQMLLSFTETAEKGLKEMKTALVSGQMEQLSDLAHKMLPPARHIGASDLCNILKKIEEGINNKSETGHVETLISALTSEIESVNELIKERIAKIS